MLSHEDYSRRVNELNRHAQRYYRDNHSVISDSEYDQRYHQLVQFESNNPLLVHPNSPTQRIGEPPLDQFDPFTHRTVLPSLNNVFNQDDLIAFCDRVYKGLNTQDIAFCIEPKVDGLAVALHYQKGILVAGSTRGDGTVGELITANLKTIRSLPLSLPEPIDLEVRGEVYMSKSQFATLSDQFANPRNAAAGSMRQLDSRIAAQRRLDIMVYQGILPGYSCHSEIMARLNELGFPINPGLVVTPSVSELYSHAKVIESTRWDYQYDIDGAVIKVDPLDYQDQLGMTIKSPRWATAYKFAAEEGITRLDSISVQVGRTGVLTPVAKLTPLLLSGVTITHATLHNMDEILRLDIQVGDDVVVVRSGDVIPKVIRRAKRHPHSVQFIIPSYCPICETSVCHDANEVAYRCPNTQCPARIKGQIAHFASRKAMNIDGLGKEMVASLVDSGLVKKVPDLYTLSVNQLLPLDGVAQKSADSLIAAIQDSHTQSLPHLLFGLGMAFVGIHSATVLAHRYLSLSGLLSATHDDLIAIEGIGPKIADAVISYLEDPSFIADIHTLQSLGVNPTVTPVITNGPLNGQTFLITGSLSHYKRSEAEDLIKQQGGKVVSSVSKTLSYLIVGTNPGSKLTKAEKLNTKELYITILDEDTFRQLLN